MTEPNKTNLGVQVLLGYLLCDAIEKKDTTQATTALNAGADLTVSRLFVNIQLRPLEMAIETGQDAIAKQLISSGAPLTANPAYEDDNFTNHNSVPFLLAAHNKNWGVLDAIIKQQPPEETDQWMRERIFHAAIGNHGDEIKVLIGLGANPNAHDPQIKQTPLAHAAALGHVNAIQALVDAGADWDFPDNKQRTPADWLRGNNPTLAAKFGLDQPEVVVRMVPRVLGKRRSP